MTGRSRTSSPSFPGPKARAHVAFDETWTSPSLPRAYPIVPVRGDGLDRRGHRRQPLPRLRRRHRGQLDRPRPSAGRRRDQGAGGRADPLLGVATSTCRSTPRSASELAGSRRSPAAGRGPTSATPGTEVVEAAIKLARLRDQAAVHRRVPRRVPRPDLRLGLADRVEGEVPRGLRAAAAGRLPRAVRQGRGPALVRRGPVRQARARRTRSRRSSSSRSRARAATSSPRTASSRASARSATSTASCSSPTRSSRAPGGPARCGRSSTGASSRTSC